MPIDYKLKTLRRLFGVNNFFRFPPGAKRSVLGAASKEVKESDRPNDIPSAKDAESDRPARVRASKSVKAGGGTPRAFFKGQAPRAVRSKAVGSQLNLIHLFEKQKMRVYYGAIRDEKFKKYVEEAKKKRFNTDAALIRLLELRLDTLLYRTSFARTPMEGRQWISHKQICVNGEPLNIKSAQLRPGDVISIRDRFIERATESCMMNASMRKSLGIGSSWILSRSSAVGLIPWLEVDRGGLSAALVRVPSDDEVRALQHASLFPFIRDAQLNPHAAMRAYR